ncbi:MAG: hypothetical protein K8R67_15905 [Desulfobacteraceae bacterium]|nr:hypothetical protein [Desulfobacteraceae bacterium]
MNYFFTLIMCMAFFIGGCGNTDNQHQAFPEKTNIDLQGHRGARGLYPENTISAFQYAIEQKMTTLELDTNLTKDGNLIVYHDSSINPNLCLDSKGNPAQSTRILDMTLEDLKKLDCGSLINEKFPEQTLVPGTRLISLSEFFDFAKQYEAEHPDIPKLRFNVETKFESEPGQEYLEKFAMTMVKLIEDADVVDRTTVQSFALEVLPLIKKRNPKLKTSALFQPTRVQGLLMMIGLNSIRTKIIEKAEKVKADIISPYHLYANLFFIQTCHKKNIQVIPWTVNEKKKILTLLNNGVDGIISDYPNRLFAVYQEWLNPKQKE